MKEKSKPVNSFQSSATRNLSSQTDVRDLFIQPSAVGGFHNSKPKIHNSKSPQWQNKK